MEKPKVDCRVVVLAAGYGKRMNNPNLPKVLVSLKSRPIIRHLLEEVEQINISGKPVVVIGQKAEMVRQELGDSCEYVYQMEQLGTGHAVNCTKELLQNKCDYVFVLYGDQPFVQHETITKIIIEHINNKAALTLGVVRLEKFDGWHAIFNDFGRVIRDTNKRIEKIVEKKDCLPAELLVNELNAGIYCFKADWLWPALNMVKNINAQQEYYLTDLVDIAYAAGATICSVIVEPEEAFGINNIEQLKLAEKIMKK